jgi:Tfp pilus assembly protein PilF
MYATQGRLEEAGASYCEALDLARSRGLKYVEARVLHWMGLLSMQRGDEREAQRRLEDALTLFRRLGARPYVARTAEVLESLSAGSSAARERAR